MPPSEGPPPSTRPVLFSISRVRGSALCRYLLGWLTLRIFGRVPETDPTLETLEHYLWIFA
jgi:hypothetical protein